VGGAEVGGAKVGGAKVGGAEVGGAKVGCNRNGRALYVHVHMFSPDKSPPRSCGILNPPTHLEGNPCLTP
jgi:hypothetical protein